MSKKDKKISTDFTSGVSTDHLSSEEIEELQKIIQEITDQAKNVVEDYVKNPSDASGSTIQIHYDSPLISSGSSDT